MIVSGTAGARLTPQLNGKGGARLTPQLNGKGGSPLANDRVLPLSPLKCGTWMVVSKTIVDPRRLWAAQPMKSERSSQTIIAFDNY